VQLQGLTIQKKSSAILQFLALYSENGEQDPLFYLKLRRHQRARRVSRNPWGGTAGCSHAHYSMRIWFDTKRLDSLALTPADVIARYKRRTSRRHRRIGARPIETISN